MISVITTTYNCGSYISQSIKSILRQSFNNYELLIIDDGSEDDTEEKVNAINDERIKYIRTKHLGRSTALNYAVQVSQFDIIAIHDADDIAHPRRFEEQLKYLKNENELIFTQTAYFKKNKLLYKISNNLNENTFGKFYLHGHYNNSSSMFYKKILISENGYNESLYVYEDYQFWMRIKDTAKFKVVPQILQYVRIRNGSLSTSRPMDNKKLLYEIQKPYFEYKELSRYFKEKDEINRILGLRELFYGEKKTARKHWSLINMKKRGINYNLYYLLSYLPEQILDYLKNNRIKQFIIFYLSYSSDIIILRKEFNKLISELQ